MNRIVKAVLVCIYMLQMIVTYLRIDPPPPGQEFVYAIAAVLYFMFVVFILHTYIHQPKVKSKMDRSEDGDR